ncbi:hypothetical protein JTB14_014361 [Gonioctena quinquepunctata]|nr:hypothetical protein JTB14_014361 [Gonioctena quinquepunctata]
MKLENCKKSVSHAQNPNKISDDVFNKLLDNCFAILTGNEEVHSMTSLYHSKPDIVKEFYAALLTVSAEFTRRKLSKEDILQYLTGDCGLPSAKVNLFIDNFEKNRLGIERSLLNIGVALPHITDVKWKIDYIVKSNTMDSSEGPIFRISLVAEQFDAESEQKKIENITFSCTSQELQDFVYKLKDALRHCSSITHKIL